MSMGRKEGAGEAQPSGDCTDGRAARGGAEE